MRGFASVINGYTSQTVAIFVEYRSDGSLVPISVQRNRTGYRHYNVQENT